MSATKPNYNDRLKDYIPVAERIDIFYQQHPQGRIITHIIEHDIENGFVLIRAEGYRNPDDAQPAASGHAFEYRESSHVNKTSYIENAETSAVGRMCAMLGIETKRGIASREEMEKVDRAKAMPLQAVKSSPAVDVPPASTDEWQCGESLKKQILDMEAAADELGIYKVMRDKLEVSIGSRNPSNASPEMAQKYVEWMAGRIRKEREG